MIFSQDLQGQAALEYYLTKGPVQLMIGNNYGEPEEMPMEVFFREEEDLDELEFRAMDCCQGRVLDVGAGAGSHALILQNIGCKVDANEVSEAMISVMKMRGVESIIPGDIRSLKSGEYDTILLMMNGLGVAGTLSGLNPLLLHLKSLLAFGGQIIADSSDIEYLYDKMPMPKDRYYGEVDFRFQYKGQRGDWFKWLYVDQERLAKACKETGFEMEILYVDEQNQYLVRLLPILD